MVDGPNGDAGVTVSMVSAKDKDPAVAQDLKDSENLVMVQRWKRGVSCNNEMDLRINTEDFL